MNMVDFGAGSVFLPAITHSLLFAGEGWVESEWAIVRHMIEMD
jgi:hypothetical protein